MNPWYFAAAVMMFATSGLHVFGGGPEIHVPIQNSELAIELRAISAVLWHAVTVILVVFTAGYLWSARMGGRSIVALMGVTQVGFAGLFVYYGTTLLGSVWPMPQWIIFLSVPLVSFIGMRQRVIASRL